MSKKSSEIWKVIPAQSLSRREGYFEASSFGRIREETDDGYLYLEPFFSRVNKLQIIRFSKNRQRPVHQLVLHAFKGLKPQGCSEFVYRAKHLDGNFLNNTPENLAWIKVPREEAAV